ncbi:hypothetical protein K438DRAFT_1763910 [Mycena galopus ATCC 62051]|nr:hypothetical protein K438DRAFT_1763910 [Mycena galopus ATCC 62051]
MKRVTLHFKVKGTGVLEAARGRNVNISFDSAVYRGQAISVPLLPFEVGELGFKVVVKRTKRSPRSPPPYAFGTSMLWHCGVFLSAMYHRAIKVDLTAPRMKQREKWYHTVRPRLLQIGPMLQEEAMRALEHPVAHDRCVLLEIRRKRVLVERVEGRSGSGVARVMRKRLCNLRFGGAREEVGLSVVDELGSGAVAVGSDHWEAEGGMTRDILRAVNEKRIQILGLRAAADCPTNLGLPRSTSAYPPPTSVYPCTRRQRLVDVGLPLSTSVYVTWTPPLPPPTPGYLGLFRYTD